jgi:hypothetical protein
LRVGRLGGSMNMIARLPVIHTDTLTHTHTHIHTHTLRVLPVTNNGYP